MRLVIRKHHCQFISDLATELGASESEALNYLLWQYRRPSPTSQSTSASTLMGFEPLQPLPQAQLEAKATAMTGLSFVPQSPQAIQEYEDLAEEIDPVIAKMVSLLENF